jgi:hypothetical protein
MTETSCAAVNLAFSGVPTHPFLEEAIQDLLIEEPIAVLGK